MHAPVHVIEGRSPLILAQPHSATALTPEIEAKLNARGRALADTDWHVDALYDGLAPEATVVRAGLHRYVLDVNRPPDDESLYPGQNTTGLCPVTDFEGQPIYAEGMAPDADAIAGRRALVHAPYHAALTAQIQRLKAKWGVVVLYDCHSIRGEIPHLFDGRLPNLNIGTHEGASADDGVKELVEQWREEAEKLGFSTVTNGRFKGGWTTRHYGKPEDGVHAVQMEIAQRTYMEEAPPWTWDEAKAQKLRGALGVLLAALSQYAGARSAALQVGNGK